MTATKKARGTRKVAKKKSVKRVPKAKKAAKRAPATKKSSRVKSDTVILGIKVTRTERQRLHTLAEKHTRGNLSAFVRTSALNYKG